MATIIRKRGFVIMSQYADFEKYLSGAVDLPGIESSWTTGALMITVSFRISISFVVSKRQ